MVSATGILSHSTSLELSVGSAHNAIDISIGNPKLTRSAAGLTELPLLYPDAVQKDYIPDMRFGGGRVGAQRGRLLYGNGPFTNENTTYDVIANLTKVWGSHSAKVGVYFQSS